MRQLLGNTGAKFLAWVLLTAFLLTGTVLAFGAAWLFASGAYSQSSPVSLRQFWDYSPAFDSYQQAAQSYYRVYTARQEAEDPFDPQWRTPYLEQFDRNNSNYYFAVYDSAGNLVFSGGQGNSTKNGATDFAASAYLYQRTDTRSFTRDIGTVTSQMVFDDETAMWAWIQEQFDRPDTHSFAYKVQEGDEKFGEVTEWVVDYGYVEQEYDHYTLVGYVREGFTAQDGLYREYRLVQGLVENRGLVLAGLVGCLIGGLAVILFLLCAAGHRNGVEGIHLCWFHRIPFDLFAFLVFCAVGLLMGLASELSSGSSVLFVAVCMVTGLLLALLTVGVLVSISARIKAKQLLKNTLVFRILRLIGRGFRYLVRHLPLYWKAGLAWFLLSFCEFLAILIWGSGDLALCWFLGKVVLTGVLVVAVVNLQQLRQGAERLAAGKLSGEIDTQRMFWEFKRHGESLNAIGDGMLKAVDERMRSERLKTELITNVSHDIKTPLTSIVNYVDLLKKEELGSSKAQEYVEVLDRQAARLKKLTEDLVEASKASTGNLSCTLEQTDVNVLLHQVLGEYEERLAAAKLEPLLQTAEKQPRILADGRLLWRVFDNLLSNVCKYAMPGTRVYLASTVLNGRVTVSFKNISKFALNITPEELMERFVRGDSSRSTEGSGLGLSIAKSLTELQGGILTLMTDGDLFKASVCFALLEEEKEEVEPT